MSETLNQLRQAKEEARNGNANTTSEETAELPEGSSPVEARAQTPEVETAAPEEVETEAAPEGDKKKTGSFRIGTEVFDTQEEAFKYAEELERRNTQAEAYNQGIRDTLQTQQSAGGNAAQTEPEDNFEERFYSNPKEALKDIEEKAVARALQTIEAANVRERAWTEFITEHPDIRRKDAERVLAENWDTLGKMTDYAKAKKILANKVRDEYREIIEAAKPRTELRDKRQTASASGGTPNSVTHAKKNDAPLDFVSQMKTLNKR